MANTLSRLIINYSSNKNRPAMGSLSKTNKSKYKIFITNPMGLHTLFYP